MDGGWSEPGRLSIAALVTVTVRPARPRAQPEMPSFKPGIFTPSFCNPNTFFKPINKSLFVYIFILYTM